MGLVSCCEREAPKKGIKHQLDPQDQLVFRPSPEVSLSGSQSGAKSIVSVKNRVAQFSTSSQSQRPPVLEIEGIAAERPEPSKSIKSQLLDPSVTKQSRSTAEYSQLQDPTSRTVAEFSQLQDRESQLSRATISYNSNAAYSQLQDVPSRNSTTTHSESRQYSANISESSRAESVSTASHSSGNVSALRGILANASSQSTPQRTQPEITGSSISSEERNAVKAALEMALASGTKPKLNKGAVYTNDESSGRVPLFGASPRERVANEPETKEPAKLSNAPALSKPKVAGRSKKKPNQGSKFQTAPTNFNSEPQSNICKVCGKPAYQNEAVVYDQSTWHNNCFRCSQCNSIVSLKNVAMAGGNLYCKNCFKRGFLAGSYAALEDSSTAAALLQQPANGHESDIKEEEDEEPDFSGLTLQERQQAWEQMREKKAQQEQSKLQEKLERADEFQRSLPKPNQDAFAEAQKALETQMIEKQELEVKMGANGLDQVFEAHTGDVLNLNNVQAFIKATDEQRTERYLSVIDFLRQHPNVVSFTAAASGIRDEFAIMLGTYLSENPPLIEVNLENNQLTEKGIAALADGLVSNTNLKTLKLIANTTATAAGEALSNLVDPSNTSRNHAIEKITFDFKMAQHRDRYTKGVAHNHDVARGWKTI